jgi:hypothetical protein
MILSTSYLSGIRTTTMTSPLGTFKKLNGLSHKSRPDTNNTSSEYLEGRAQEAKKDTSWEVRNAWPDVPASLLNTMLELLYTGHPDLAWEFLEMAWPPNIPDKDDWVSDFRATLEESQFWPLDSKRAYFVP